MEQQPLRGRPCGLVAVRGGDDPRTWNWRRAPEEDEDRLLEAANVMGRPLTMMLVKKLGPEAMGDDGEIQERN